MTVNPASANGLEACTPAQIGLGTDEAIGCPDASRIADVEVTTPVLPNPVGGTVYLATQYDNPFGSLLAIYLVLSEPERGILVKIPGRVEVDSRPGQQVPHRGRRPHRSGRGHLGQRQGAGHAEATDPLRVAANLSDVQAQGDVAATAQQLAAGSKPWCSPEDSASTPRVSRLSLRMRATLDDGGPQPSGQGLPSLRAAVSLISSAPTTARASSPASMASTSFS